MKILLLESLILELSIISAYFFGFFYESERKFFLAINLTIIISSIFLVIFMGRSIALVVCMICAILVAWIMGSLLTVNLNILVIVLVALIGSVVNTVFVDIATISNPVSICILLKMFLIFLFVNFVFISLVKFHLIK